MRYKRRLIRLMRFGFIRLGVIRLGLLPKIWKFPLPSASGVQSAYSVQQRHENDDVNEKRISGD